MTRYRLKNIFIYRFLIFLIFPFKRTICDVGYTKINNSGQKGRQDCTKNALVVDNLRKD